MKVFKDVLMSLDDVEDIQRIELFDEDSNLAGELINKPGSSGSVKVYNHLFKTFGSISVEAAKEGLTLFAEHTQGAKDAPGQHPNIDRLFSIIDEQKPLTVKLIKA